MASSVAFSCPTCSAPLPEYRGKCAYCGTEYKRVDDWKEPLGVVESHWTIPMTNVGITGISFGVTGLGYCDGGGETGYCFVDSENETGPSFSFEKSKKSMWSRLKCWAEKLIMCDES